jgi:drug/metabolite transporter (DMT)-like permease
MYNTSIMLTTATNATLLGNNAPLWVGLGAWLLFRTRPSAMYWIGLAVALGGTLAIVGADMLHHPSFGAGDLLACAAAVCFAGYLLAVERVRAHTQTDTLTLTTITVCASTVGVLFMALLFGAPLGGYSLTTWGALIALGLIAQVGGYLALTYALGHLPATVTSVCLLVQAPITALLAVPLLGESISTLQIVGGALVLGGIYPVNRGEAA